ncbi:MAG: hypothetical protein R3C17_16940 [Planctomycetaceae bacterium]
MTQRRDKKSPPSQKAAVFTLIAAAWIIGFLWYFFAQSIDDPNLPRTELWAMMADEVLGLSDAVPAQPTSELKSGLPFLSQRIPLFTWAAAILLLAGLHGDAIYLLVLRRCRLFPDRTDRDSFWDRPRRTFQRDSLHRSRGTIDTARGYCPGDYQPHDVVFYTLEMPK